MINYNTLVDTASLYSHRAKSDEKYIFPAKVLNDAVRELKVDCVANLNRINNSDQFIVTRVPEPSGALELIQHPLDVVDKGVNLGIESLKSRGIDGAHTCLIAVPRGSLTGVFTYIYEVVRGIGWSVLPLGGSTDGRDISRLCSTYGVDVLIVAADALDLVFTPDLIGQFDNIKRLLYVSGLPTQKAMNTIESFFPHLKISPFLYLSDVVGPIGAPTAESKGDSFEVFENIFVEVQSKGGEVALNGSGRLLVSVLGIEQSSLIRRNIGDFGTLTTSEKGEQIIKLSRDDIIL